jgi:hypothetical protein
MERELADVFPIWGVEKDCIVSTMGDYTAAFAVTKPEIFTLSAADYDHMHQTLVKAIKVLPTNCVLHFQDWYMEAKYSASADPAGQSFLDQASDRFFEGRPYLDHLAYCYITKKPSGRKAASSAVSGLFRKTLVPEETLSSGQVREFLDCVGQFQRILEDGKQWGLRRVTEKEIWSDAGTTGFPSDWVFSERFSLILSESIPFWAAVFTVGAIQ